MSPDATPTEYVQAVAPLAREAQRRFGIPASVAIAQSALETGWGKSANAQKANNYFGMRTGGAASDPFWNGDAFNGWRKYRRPLDSFLDWAYGFYTYAGYRDALVFRGDPTAFVLAEAPVYAPPSDGNPDYAARVLNILSSYDLARFDLPASQLALDPNLVPPEYRA